MESAPATVDVHQASPSAAAAAVPAGGTDRDALQPRAPQRLRLLPPELLAEVNRSDPINVALMRFYRLPVFGKMYRRRVEMCLDQCCGGDAVLEVGFGIGLTFWNLSRLYRRIHGLDLEVNVAEVARLHAEQGIAANLTNGNVLNMPYDDGSFDTVLLISILEHLKPQEQDQAFRELRRVLKPGGQVVYGVPIERPLMVFMFRVLGWDIRKLHFSTEIQVRAAAARHLCEVGVRQMPSCPQWFGAVYEVGHFVRQ